MKILMTVAAKYPTCKLAEYLYLLQKWISNIQNKQNKQNYEKQSIAITETTHQYCFLRYINGSIKALAAQCQWLFQTFD